MPLPSVEERVLPDGSKVPVERNLYLRSRVRNDVKAKYEDWLEGRARRRLFEKKGEMTVDEYKDSLRAVATGVAAGDYSWGGDAWRHSWTQLPGQVKMLHLLANDADDLLNSQGREPQRLTESAMLHHYIDKGVGPILGQFLIDVRTADPNFLESPVRGVPD